MLLRPPPDLMPIARPHHTLLKARVRLYEESCRLLEKMTGERLANELESKVAC